MIWLTLSDGYDRRPRLGAACCSGPALQRATSGCPATEPIANRRDRQQHGAERHTPKPPARQERIPLAILYMVAPARSSRSPAPRRNGWWRPIRWARCCSAACSSRSSCSRPSSCRPPAWPCSTPAGRRACAAQHVAVHVADAAAHRLQHDAAGQRHRDQLLRAAVCDAGLASCS